MPASVGELMIGDGISSPSNPPLTAPPAAHISVGGVFPVAIAAAVPAKKTTNAAPSPVTAISVVLRGTGGAYQLLSCAGKPSLAWVHTKGNRKTTTLFSRIQYTLGAGTTKMFTVHISKEAIKRLENGELQVRARATVHGGAIVHRFVPLVIG
jgi:hypothetical protein